MATRIEMILGAKDESGPALDNYGRNVKRTFQQAGQDAQEAARGTSILDAATGGLVNTFKLAGAALGLYGGFQLADLAKNAVVLAARYETLGATLNNLGKNAGYSASFLEAQEAALRKTGISAVGARESLARMMQANLDLSKASQLARVAQDAAAVAGINSTEAYQHLVYGIQSAQVEMLCTVGLNVSFEQSYAAVAAQTGRTADSLSEAEKAQIRLNAVLEAGKNIAGTYEAAMGTAGKQMLSFARYWEDMQVELGKAFGPALTSIIEHATLSMKGFTETVASSTIQGALATVGNAVAFTVNHLDALAVALGMASVAWTVFRAESFWAAGMKATELGLVEKAVLGISTALGGMKSGMGEVTDAVKTFTMLQRNGFTQAEAATLALKFATEGLRAKLASLWALMAANPATTAAIGVAALVTAYYALHKSAGDYAKEAGEVSREIKAAADAHQKAQKDVAELTRALESYDDALTRAGGNQGKEKAALDDLNRLYPSLAGNYQTTAQGIANVNQHRDAMLAKLRAEIELNKSLLNTQNEAALKKIREALDNARALAARATINLENSLLPESWFFNKSKLEEITTTTQQVIRNLLTVREIPLLDPGHAEESRELATALEGVLQVFGKIKGIAPETRAAIEAALTGATKAAVAVPAEVKLAWSSKDISATYKDLTKLQAETTAMLAKAGMNPVQAKLYDIDQAELDKSLALWARDLPLEMTQAGMDSITAWGDAQRATLGPEIAKTRTEMVRGMHDLGQASRGKVLENLEAEAAAYAAGGERTRQQYLASQKALTDTRLQYLHEDQAIAQARVNLGSADQDDLIKAYREELALLPQLQMRSEERTKRELELNANIRDAERAKLSTLQEIETLKVSWLEEGAAKEEASLEESIKRERAALEQKIKDTKAYQADAQALRAQFDAHADRQRDKQANKEKQNGLEIAAQTARLAGDSRRAKELELEKYILSLKHSNYTELEQAQLIANKRVEINQTGLDRMLLEQADFYEGWDKIGENAISGIQSDLVTNFKNAFQGIEGFWAATWESMQDVAFQAFAAIAARLATYGLSNLILAVMPGLGGALGPLAGGTDTVGSALSLASLGSSAVNAYNWFANGGLSTLGTLGTYGGFGSSLFSWGPGATGATAGGWEMATPLQANGLSGMGYAVSGIGGALTGWQLAQMLYGNGVGGQIGGALGGAGGGIGGAMLGTMIMPGIGTVIGGLLGGLGGGALGGGLGSLFDSEDDRAEYEKPGNYAAHYEELSKRVKDYTKALKESTISQADFLDEVGKMAPLAAGSGDYLAGYGGIIGGTIEKLSGLSAGTEEYARVVREELNPAWIISKGLADDLANGMSELDARKKALSNSIDALAASSGLDEDQQSQLIDLIISQSGSVADLTAKYERYNEIKQQLLNAHNMERGQVEALAAELRGLHDELGIQADPMTNLAEVAGSLNETLTSLDATLRSIMGLPDNKEINVKVNYSQNGELGTGAANSYHTGGMIRAALASNLITRHGGGEVPLYAHTGLGLGWPAPQPGEVDIRALVGEWVINRQAVDYYGQDFMAAVNAMRVPVVRASQAARQVAAPAATGQSGQRRTVPIVNISFAGATFGSDPNQVASAVDRRMRTTLADMNERGEWPGNSDSMGVTW